MKCLVLVASNMSSFPLAECGGLILADGDKLIVKEDIAQRMLVQYRPRLALVCETEREKLARGHFEHESAGVRPETIDPKGKVVEQARVAKPAQEPKELSDVSIEKDMVEEEASAESESEKDVHKKSANKSMQGKSKAKRK